MTGKTGMTSTQSVTPKIMPWISVKKRRISMQRVKRLRFWSNASGRWNLLWLPGPYLSPWPSLIHFPWQKPSPSTLPLQPQIKILNLQNKLIPNRTYPPSLMIFLSKWAASPQMMWVGGSKYSLASPLLQMDTGEVGRTPVWRISYDWPKNTSQTNAIGH